MKSKFLLIQFRTDASAAHEVDCLRRYGELAASQLVVKNILSDSLGPPADELAGVAGLILGGSGEFYLSDPGALSPHLENFWPLLDYALDHDLPTLGACFGHQLLGHRLGGRVEHAHQYAETGSYQIKLTNNGQADPLFTAVPNSFAAQVGHKDSVTRLPDGCVLLAHTDTCPVHAFRYKNHIYGVQFHAELGREDLLYRLTLYPHYLKGRTIDEARADFLDSPHAPQVFKNFLRLAATAPRG